MISQREDLEKSMLKTSVQKEVKTYWDKVYSLVDSELQGFMFHELGVTKEQVLKGEVGQLFLSLKMDVTRCNTESYYFKDSLILVLKRYEDGSTEVFPVWRNNKEEG